MKKLLQKIYCYRTIAVHDVNTGLRQNATYHMVLGLPVKINYEPLKTIKEWDGQLTSC